MRVGAPQTMDSKHVPREVYRSSELNEVMRAHEQNAQDMRRFNHENEQVASEPREAAAVLDDGPSAGAEAAADQCILAATP